MERSLLSKEVRCCGKDRGKLFVKKGDRYFISGKVAFHLYDTHGLPLEVIEYGITERIRKIITQIT